LASPGHEQVPVFFAEDQAVRTGDQVGLASRAEEELVANSRIFVLVVTVHAGAVGRRIGRLEFGTITAVDIERVIATALGAAGRAQIGENQAVRAEFLRQNKVVTFVVTIALSGIGKNTVFLWTIAVLRSNGNGDDKDEEEFGHLLLLSILDGRDNKMNLICLR